MSDTVEFVQKWMMSGDHEADQWHREFAAAIDDRTASLVMIEAVMAARALATCCMATSCYSRDELVEMARATKPKFDMAIAKATGSSS